MLNMPTRPLPEGVRRELDRFKSTSAALELGADRRTWTVVECSWSDELPLYINLRAEDGTWLAFRMDDPGIWRLTPVPIQERFRTSPDATSPSRERKEV
jgi:hypothetical protein